MDSGKPATKSLRASSVAILVSSCRLLTTSPPQPVTGPGREGARNDIVRLAGVQAIALLIRVFLVKLRVSSAADEARYHRQPYRRQRVSQAPPAGNPFSSRASAARRDSPRDRGAGSC